MKKMFHQGCIKESQSLFLQSRFQTPARILLNCTDFFLLGEDPKPLSSLAISTTMSHSSSSDLWICDFSFFSAPSTGEGFHQAMRVSLLGLAPQQCHCWESEWKAVDNGHFLSAKCPSQPNVLKPSEHSKQAGSLPIFMADTELNISLFPRGWTSLQNSSQCQLTYFSGHWHMLFQNMPT